VKRKDTAPTTSRSLAWPYKLALAVGAPLLFFVMVEAALRVAGFGRDPNYFIPDEKPGFHRTNPRFTEMFFPASFGLKPVNFRLPKEKPAGTVRVFVIGESAAMGVPEPAFGLAPQLEAQLRAVRPGTRAEVFNLGMTAINSHAILSVVRQALEFNPDLLVIYMGNNEVVGPYGSSSVVTQGPLPLPLIRAGSWARSTRIGQWVQRTMARVGKGLGDRRDWRGMEMFTGKAIAASDPGLVRVRDNFRENLDDMLAAARKAGVKVVLSTVAVNVRDCSPFVSLPQPDARDNAAWRAAWNEGLRAAQSGEHERAREAMARAVAADPGHADSHFLLATSLESLGETAAARAEYLAALEADALRFRADAGINAVIREAAQAQPGHVHLVDAARELGCAPDSLVPPAGAELFFEHVHFTWEGNVALARLLAEACADLLFGPAATSRPWLDAAGCAQAVGYTDLARLAMLRGMEQLTNRPPFTGQLRYAADRTRLLRQIAETEGRLASPAAASAGMKTIASALERDPTNPFLLFQASLAAVQAGDHAGGSRLIGRLAAAQPFSAEQGVLHAALLQAQGQRATAEEMLRRAIATEPYYLQSYGMLGRLLADDGRLDAALPYFADLVERMPDSRAVRLTYAQLLARRGDWPAVERQWRAVLAGVPDDEGALAPLLRRLAEAGREAEALPLVLAAHAYNPRSFANNQRLVEYYDARGDLAATIKSMEDLAESGPVNPRLFRDLAVNLRKLDRLAEARVALQRGRRAAMEENDAAAMAEFDRLLRQS
jgi:tetratricopeptide (TPR) repeat protein